MAENEDCIDKWYKSCIIEANNPFQFQSLSFSMHYLSYSMFGNPRLLNHISHTLNILSYPKFFHISYNFYTHIFY